LKYYLAVPMSAGPGREEIARKNRQVGELLNGPANNLFPDISDTGGPFTALAVHFVR
jgi:hypothetical protein